MKKGISALLFMTACVVFGDGKTAEKWMSGEGATLRAQPYPVENITDGEFIFPDRDFTFLKPPAGLTGMKFLQAPIAGEMNIVVEKDGLLTVITPDPTVKNAMCSNAKQLEEYGFSLIQSQPAFQCFGSSPVDSCLVYQKAVKSGETFRFKKWVIIAGFKSAPVLDTYYKGMSPALKSVIAKLKKDTSRRDARFDAVDIRVNHPDYVVFIPKQPRNASNRDLSKPGDTYNDHFQVIYKPQNGMLFAFWTQASREADIDQHIAFSRSADKGLTWSDPVIVAGSPNKRNPALLASWQQPMLAKSGRLYCLWNQQTTSRGPHCGQMFGAFSDDDGITWSAPKMVPMNVRMDADPADPLIPPSWCNWQRPLRLGQDGRFLVGVSRHGQAPYDKKYGCKVEFLQFNNIDENPTVDRIKLSHFSTNKNALKVDAVNNYEPACEEAAIVKLPDGRLFAMMRSSIGYPVWSQSRDNGVTWSKVKILLNKDGGKPWPHPRSPCPLYDWKGCEAGSGTYFALIHNTFDFNGKTAYQHRGPLYLIAGKFNPNAEQPIEFADPKLFAPRTGGNSFYASYTVMDGKGVLWFNDVKFYLLGRVIGEEWFK